MVELRHRAKFGRNRSNRDRDMAIFRFPKTAAAVMLIFKFLKFLRSERLRDQTASPCVCQVSTARDSISGPGTTTQQS